jgi:superfamily II DNA or RNA helicase
MLNRNHLAQFFTYSAVAKADAYRREGRVHGLEISDDHGQIRASVRGSRHEDYDVKIGLTWKAGRIRTVNGRCSCPMNFNCKHVAATLLQAYDRDDDDLEPAPNAAPRDAAPPPLPHDVSRWLEQVTKAPRRDDYPPDVRQRLIYILEPKALGAEMPHPTVAVRSVRLLKDDTFAKDVSRHQGLGFDRDRAPKFYRESDLDILSRLQKERAGSWHADVYAVQSSDLIERAVATGRAFWKALQGAPLRWGEARRGRIEWRLASASGNRPYVIVEGAIALNAEPPLYVDEAAGVIGPVALDVPAGLAYRLLAAPPIAPAHVAQVARRLAEKLPGLSPELLPAEPEAPQQIDEDPVPVLHLILGRGVTYSSYAEAPRPLALAQLRFRYGGIEIRPSAQEKKVEAFHDGRIYAIARRAAREKEARKRLTGCGFAPASKIHPYIAQDHRNDFAFATDRQWLDFLNHKLAPLRAQGFEIEIDRHFPYRLAEASGTIDAELESSGIDWFELKLGLEIDGARLDVSVALAALLNTAGFEAGEIESLAQRDEPYYLRLADGRHVALAAARLLPLVLALHAMRLSGHFSAASGKAALSRRDIVPLLDFETSGFSFGGADKLRRLAGLLRSQQLAGPSLPADFKAELRPYQLAGVAWLDLLREAGLGGILADDMGLGKTVQILALLAMEKDRGNASEPILIVAPTSLMENWSREARKFAPSLKVLVLHGLARKQLFDSIAKHDLVLTTYPLIARDREVLLSRDWHMAVLDEAQVIKNPAAATSRWLHDIKAEHRFCLTGTPMENHLGELWSLMSFVNPGYLGDKTAFARTWRTAIEKRGDKERAAALRRRVKPFLLRRTKAEVATELPPKTEIVEKITLEGPQRELYDAVRISMAAKVREAIAERGLARSHIVVLEALLRMRQACCDPRLLKLDDTVERPSAKLERLLAMVSELLSEGRKIILFSQFTSMLEIIRIRFDEAEIRYSLLTGETRNRKKAIDRFQDGTNDVFLVSLKAGGVGLNLTAADTVIIFDPWWNPAVEEQAIDRAYRIGQDKAVFVYRLTAADTIEEKMDELKARKRALADGLYDREGRIDSALTEQDVAALFEA